MTFQDDFNAILSTYVGENVVFGFRYKQAQGANIDVGDTMEFNIEVSNNGDLGMSNVTVSVSARRGKLSQSWYAGWLDPWQSDITLRTFNVGPNSTELIKHEVANTNLFAFKAEHVTAGDDNAREVEDLITARIELWQPDIKTSFYRPDPSPSWTYRDFIQRP